MSGKSNVAATEGLNQHSIENLRRRHLSDAADALSYPNEINPICWRRSTTFKKFHNLGSIFSCIALLSLVYGLPAENKTATLAKQINACHTPQCFRDALGILGRMKPEIKPCDDFYEFACGTFIDKTPIPENKDWVSTVSEIADKLQEQLKDIIIEERPESDPKYLKLPNALYRACINENSIETLGPKPMKQIARKLGGWPVTDCECWDRNGTWSWQKTVTKLGHLGFNTDYMFDLMVTPNRMNRTKHIIALYQPSTSFGYKSLVEGFNGPFASAYYDYMINMAVFFGAERDIAKTELRKSLQFEMDLANISFATQETDNSNGWNLRSIRQLQESYPYVNWSDYINGILPKGVTVDDDEIINVLVPSFFEELGKLLKSTKKSIIGNYLMWRAHEFSARFLSKELRKRKSQYMDERLEPRWKECVNMVLDNFGVSVGSLYVRKHFNPQSKVDALELVNNIRHAFGQILEQAQWMDNVTKQEAKKKLNAIKNHVGYPAEILNHTLLEGVFRKMKPIDPEKYFQAVLRINFLKNYFSFRKLRLPVKKNDWTMYANPIDINAYYSRTDNSIELSAGILQDQFFNSQRPKYMNYGAIGFFIGHEIAHGFDGNGHRYDGEGILTDWWQPEAKEAYLEKVKCLVEQYGNYTDKQTGLNLNGVKTQNENIADNCGIKQAYLAYKVWVTENGEEPQLPGLNYTSLQMFWIAASQTWCSKYKTDYLKDEITNEHHSPNKYRVLGPFKNMQDFSSDFKCAEGTPMNPVKKCKIW